MKPEQRIAEFDAYSQPLPSEPDAERWAIATCLQWENRLKEYAGLLAVEHFSTEQHRIIWGAIKELYDSEEKVDAHAVAFQLSRTPGLIEIAGFSYLTELHYDAQADHRAEFWAKPILNTYARRRLMLKCNEVLIRLSGRQESLAEISQEIEEEARICSVLSDPSDGFSSFADTVRECGGLDAFLSRSKGDAVPFPWSRLNQMTNGGMRPGQVIVIAGQSGKGKTALALNIVNRAAHSGYGAALVFSLEMGKEEIHARLLSLTSRVDSYHFPRLHESERPMIRFGAGQLQEFSVMVDDDDDSVTVSSIRAKVKKFMSLETVSVVMIDYVQLIETKRVAGENREQEIAKIMRGLKRMARQLKLPLIVLSQINDTEGRPEMKNLRESRSIGHTANLVIFLHFTRKYDMAAGIPTGDLDLIIGKQRSGPEGDFPLTFHAPTGRFYEPSNETEPQ